MTALINDAIDATKKIITVGLGLTTTKFAFNVAVGALFSARCFTQSDLCKARQIEAKLDRSCDVGPTILFVSAVAFFSSTAGYIAFRRWSHAPSQSRSTLAD